MALDAQRWVSDEFTIIIPKRSSGTLTSLPVRLVTTEDVIIAADFKNLLAKGDRLASIDAVTTTNAEQITLTALGVDRTLAKVEVSDFLTGVTYSLAITVTTDYGDTIIGLAPVITAS